MLLTDDGLPYKTKTTTWEARRTWELPYCAITNKVIWPWHAAWRKRIDYFYGGSVYDSRDIWVTANSYIVLKLKGDTDSVI